VRALVVPRGKRVAVLDWMYDGRDLNHITDVETPILWKQITTVFRGRAVVGSYAVEGGTVKVRTANGEKTARLGSLNEIWLAGTHRPSRAHPLDWIQKTI
jgi:hypothetical protein